MESSFLIPLLMALFIGLSVALIAGWLAQRAAEVPDEDRTYKDRPPLGMRLLWWPIHWLSHAMGPLLSVGYRQRLLGQLRVAGLDYAIAPEQFLASRIVGAGVGVVLSFALAVALQVDWSWPLAIGLAVLGYAYPALWLRDRLALRRQLTLKTLPFALDMLTLCAEAGLSLTSALKHAADKGPDGPLKEEMVRVLRDVRAGKPRAQALRQMADRMNQSAIHNWVNAMIQAESTGMDLGPVLRAQAEQRRTERFARAEKLAMEAPVKMLLPLIGFIFPCTFLILGFPIAMKFLALGL